MSIWSDIEHRVNTSIFQYRDPAIGLANAGHTMGSRYQAAKGIMAVTGLVGGGMAARAIWSSTTQLRVGMSWVRNPVANYLARYYGWTWTGTGARVYLQMSRAYRYTNYVGFAINPFATFYYLQDAEYEKAMIQWFGPLGGVFIYERYFEKPSDGVKGPNGRTSDRDGLKLVASGRPDRNRPTPKSGSRGMRRSRPESFQNNDRRKKRPKMSQAQRMRLWRMGLRWCKKHGRYDRCSLRARK